MVKKSKSFEERLYEEFYKDFEKDRGKNNAPDKMDKLGNYLRYVCGAGAVASGGLLAYSLTNDASLTDLVMEAGVTTAATGLTFHFHNVKKIFDGMYKKNTLGFLTEDEIAKVTKAGKIGRYAHFTAAISVGTSMVALMTVMPLALILVPILPFWYNYIIKKGYGALYSSAVDYTIGKRKYLNNRKFY